MPKINAESVAAHREAQIRTILDAAGALLHENGALPGMGQVAARAGLARTSVYQYFPSRAELLAALTEDMVPAWIAYLSEAMDAHEGPRERIWAYLSANLAMLASGHHTAGHELANDPQSAHFVDDHSELLHERLRSLLTAEVTRLGVDRPEVTSRLIDAQLHVVGDLMMQGLLDAEAAEAQLRTMLDPFLGSVQR